MHVTSKSIDEAFYRGMGMIRQQGIARETRNGPVLEMPHPVMTTHMKPLRNMLLHPLRNANPFFHVMESLWMLNGQNDVATVAHFVKRMAEFSDDGHTFHGAYGHRWRHHFGVDQLGVIIDMLRTDPTTRRAVLQMWDVDADLNVMNAKDIPCNNLCYFTVAGERLNMSVICRSNDMIWGAYGANAVHFSFLLEYIAEMCGLHVGEMYQYSHNYHAYTNVLDEYPRIGVECVDMYDTMNLWKGRTPLVTPIFNDDGQDLASMRSSFNVELSHFMANPMDIGAAYTHSFFPFVAMRIVQAWDSWKNKDKENALYWASQIVNADISLACTEWLERRKW